MRIAIPVVNNALCMHFGHCEVFVLLDVDENTRAITNQEAVTPPPHQPGLLPPWLAERGVTLVIAGGMGQRAQVIFQQNGIEVIVGAPALPPEELVRNYLAGNLVSGVNTCDH